MISVFYYDEETGDTIDSFHPEVCSKQRALSLFGVLSETRGSFFGLVYENDATLQFICLNDDEWRVDKPVLEENGVYYCKASKDTCIKLIGCVYDNLHIDEFVSFEFEWF